MLILIRRYDILSKLLTNYLAARPSNRYHVSDEEDHCMQYDQMSAHGIHIPRALIGRDYYQLKH